MTSDDLKPCRACGQPCEGDVCSDVCVAHREGTAWLAWERGHRLHLREQPDVWAIYSDGDVLYGTVSKALGTFVPARFVGWTPDDLRRVAELLARLECQ